MFGAFKRLFKKGSAEEVPAESTPFTATAAPPADPPSGPAATPEPPSSKRTTETTIFSAESDSFKIPYETIVQAVPKQFIKKVDARSVAKHWLTLRRSVVVEQIATGSVKVPLSALRASGPNGLFISGQDCELVDLPLKDILEQMPAGAYKRRAQRAVVVPEGIEDVFGPQGKSVRFLDKSELAPLKQTEPLARPQPTPPGSGSTSTRANQSETRITRAPAKSAKASTGKPVNSPKFAPTPPPPPSQSHSFPTPQAGETLGIPLSELLDIWPEAIRLEIAYQNLTDAICQLPITEVIEGLKRRKLQFAWKTIRGWIDAKAADSSQSAHGETPVDLPVKSVMSRFFAYQANKSTSTEKPADQPAPASVQKPSKPISFSFDPAPAPTPETSPASAKRPAPDTPENCIQVSLDAVAANWPAEIRKEFKNLADAKINLPKTQVEQGLRHGKLSFSWEELRPWIEPALDKATSHGTTQIELPLALVAPLYLKACPQANATRKTECPSDIPDLFDGGKESDGKAVALPVEPGAAPAAPARPTPQQSKAPAAPATPPAPKPAAQEHPPEPAAPAAPKKKPGQNIAEIFGQPNKKNWTPNEIVHQTTLLPHVCGALIALQDGLLVASCMPPNWKTETVAAFVPQIFGRLRQYARDLDMGELSNVSFGVQQGTLEIFNAGIIYFAALSRPGEMLPMDELSTIARELSRHTK